MVILFSTSNHGNALRVHGTLNFLELLKTDGDGLGHRHDDDSENSQARSQLS